MHVAIPDMQIDDPVHKIEAEKTDRKDNAGILVNVAESKGR